MKTLIVLLAAVALSKASSEWESFKLEHNKVYSGPVEETTRFAIFQQNLKEIEEHNKKFENGEVSWQKGITPFTDWTKEEFMEFLNLNNDLKMPEDAQEFIPDPTVSVPDKINWKAKGKVTPVKNQGACGSCWAFCITGALESQLLIKGKNLLLSEQQLVDCTKDGKYGCQGKKSAIPAAFEYIRDNGIETEKDYPYKAKQTQCTHNKTKSVAYVKSYISTKGEDKLKELIWTKGPTSVYIDASQLKDYKSGVFDTNSCTKKVNHAVLTVGYDKEGGKDYWLVKNSWGKTWGDKGYVKMARGKDLCAIGSNPFIPVV